MVRNNRELPIAIPTRGGWLAVIKFQRNQNILNEKTVTRFTFSSLKFFPCSLDNDEENGQKKPSNNALHPMSECRNGARF